MKDYERETYRLHAKQRGFLAKVERAKARVNEWIRRCEKPYVAFSGGKDSTVCLSLARGIIEDVPAVLYHEQWLLPETEAYIRTIRSLRIIASPHTHPGGVKHWANSKPSDPSFIWIEKESRHPVEDWAESNGYDGVAVGIRCAEAGYRRRHIIAKGALFQRVNGVHQCYPIAGWSDVDVWAYLVSTGTPYNPAYDRMSALDIPLRERRVGPWWNDRAASYGSIDRLRMGWPEVYNKFMREAYKR